MKHEASFADSRKEDSLPEQLEDKPVPIAMVLTCCGKTIQE